MRIGDSVVRVLCGIDMHLQVTELTDEFIICGPWTFDRCTGAEIDEELGWGVNGTGSYLRMPSQRIEERQLE